MRPELQQHSCTSACRLSATLTLNMLTASLCGGCTQRCLVKSSRADFDAQSQGIVLYGLHRRRACSIMSCERRSNPLKKKLLLLRGDTQHAALRRLRSRGVPECAACVTSCMLGPASFCCTHALHVFPTWEELTNYCCSGQKTDAPAYSVL